MERNIIYVRYNEESALNRVDKTETKKSIISTACSCDFLKNMFCNPTINMHTCWALVTYMKYTVGSLWPWLLSPLHQPFVLDTKV